MKARIESTDRIVQIKAVGPAAGTVPGETLARVWEGTTDAGVAFVAYIPLVQVRSAADNSQFERELVEHKPPDKSTQEAIDNRRF